MRATVSLCGHGLATGPCQMEVGHRGRHQHHGVWTCEGCGKTRTGSSRADEGGRWCFMCAPPWGTNLSADLLSKVDEPFMYGDGSYDDGGYDPQEAAYQRASVAWADMGRGGL